MKKKRPRRKRYRSPADKIISQFTAFRGIGHESPSAEMMHAVRRGYVPTVSIRRQGELVRLLNRNKIKYFAIP